MRFIVIPLLTAALISAVPVFAREWKFDFSKGMPVELELKDAAVNDASILADFSKSEDEWHEFLNTKPEVTFEKGKAYHVSYSYEILDAGSSKTQFYSLLRSRSGRDLYGDNWLWNRWTGAKGAINRLFRPDKDDYFLIIGVRNPGAIRITALSITEVSEEAPGKSVRVKNHGNEVLKTHEELAALRDKSEMPELLKQMLVVVCDEGSHQKARDRRTEIVKTLDPDFVDWSPFGALGKEYGIRIAQGGPEYQEYYKFEGPEHWDNRYKTFEGSGFSESVDGTLLQDQTWGEGGYFTCHNGDNWHKFYVDKIVEKAKERSGICQDNIGCATFYKGGGCFCISCESRFRNYLAERYYGEELSKLGIENVSDFSIKDRVFRYGLTGMKALNDPVIREYIKFQFKSQLLAWADCVKNIKELGKSQNRSIPVYGNQIGMQGFWPFAVIIGQFNDIIQIEEVLGMSDQKKIERGSIGYKMGRAAAHGEIPVWVRGPVSDESKQETPYTNPLYWQIHLAEALANGGVRDISLGVNTPWTGKPETLDYIDSPDMWKVWKTYSTFVNANRALLTQRKSLAKVGLIWSLPTTMFRRFYPLQIDDNSFFSKFNKTAKWLEEEHIPYDIITFGHPEFFMTDMAALKQYDLLVLPSCDAISDIQAQALKEFAKKGGQLITADGIGTYDENLNQRTTKALYGVSAVDLEDKPAALKALRSAGPVYIDAPADISLNVWMSAGGKSLDIHLLNYGADLKAGQWKALTPFKLYIRPSQNYKFGSVTFRTMDGTTRQLSYKMSSGRVEVTIPNFEAYGIVSLENAAEVEKMNADLLDARSKDLQAVKDEASKFNLY